MKQKHFSNILAFWALFFLIGCGTNQTDGSQNRAIPGKTLPNDTLWSFIPEIGMEEFNEKFHWAKVGMEGYSIALALPHQKIKGKPVKVRIIRIKDSSFKLRFLETVNITSTNNCPYKAHKGDTYWENDGHFWLTREEAVNFLIKKKWYAE